MSLAFWAALDALTAQTERVTEPATADLGFGSDLACADDLDESFAELPGDSAQLVSEAVCRRLTTPRGSLLDDPDYGIDLRSYVNRGGTDAELNELRGIVTSEVSKDDRIETVSVVVTRAGTALDVAISGETAAGPFDLTLGVTDSGALIQEITNALA